MILGRGFASGKVILFGEHAVVYGRPALAVPVTQVQAEAVVEVAAPGSGLSIVAADLGEQIVVRDAPADQPLAAAARLALAHLGLADPDWRLTVHSSIPVASGMGSGAAVSAAIVRALAEAANSKSASRQVSKSVNRRTSDTQHAIRNTQYELTAADLSALVYEVEKLHHGTPSGIDNTVIATGQPVYFMRGRPPLPFPIGRPFWLVIADTGIRSPTKITVGEVRLAWQQEPAHYEALFDRIGTVAEAARETICAGQTEALGPLMNANHALLQEIGVSCPELDALVAAARAAGALGAKLSGGGRGGNMIALATETTASDAAEALRSAGAVRVIMTAVGHAT